MRKRIARRAANDPAAGPAVRPHAIHLRAAGNRLANHLLERLEPRQLLSGGNNEQVNPPTGVSVIIGYRENPDGATDRAHLTWTDNNIVETGYRVEFSSDGVNNWAPIGPDLPSNSTVGDQVLDAGQKYFYRVRAVQGSSVSAPSASATAMTPIDRVVQVTAQAVTGGVQLRWPLDPEAVSYTVSRKRHSESRWTLLTSAPLPATSSGYFDNIGYGNAYEYSVARVTHKFYGSSDGTAYGYVYAAKGAELTENRGRALLVVDQTLAGGIGPELLRLSRDLIGDGWMVDQINVARDNGDVHLAATVKAQIQQRYFGTPGGLQSVILIGHVPVPYAGTTDWDGHPDHVGAWPSDLYYGELGTLYSDNPWTDTLTAGNPQNPDNNNVPSDGKFDQNSLPYSINVPVGRIDFANLPGMGWSFSPTIYDANQLETRLLQRYLDKDHLWRIGQAPAEPRALVDDHFGSAFAENGWRNFAPLVGAAGTYARDWESNLHTDSYLWAYGCAPGTNEGAQNVVINGTFHTPTNQYQAVFTMLFGSYFGDWNKTGNLLREFIATRGTALTTAWVGTPNWFVQGMGLGETIGEVTATSANNGGDGPYQPASVGMKGTQMALLGDPTLRMSVVPPVEDLTAERTTSGGVRLTWTPANDGGISGYYVYRATTMNGSFARITPRLLSPSQWQGQFTDNSAGTSMGAVYMVRAVKLQATPSGTYYNASTGQLIDVPASGLIVGDGEEAVLVPGELPGATLQPPTGSRLTDGAFGVRPIEGKDKDSLRAIVDELAGA